MTGKFHAVDRLRSLQIVLFLFIAAIHDNGLAEKERKTCALNAMEAELAEFMVRANEQQRTIFRCNPLLSRFARTRARDMAERGYFDHVTPENIGANDLLREFGYRLPKHYAHGRGNNVEAIAGGVREPRDAWERFLGSAAHREHLLGTHKVYREQIEYGVGYHYKANTRHGDYWVIVTARPGRSDDPTMLCTPPPSVCVEIPQHVEQAAEKDADRRD